MMFVVVVVSVVGELSTISTLVSALISPEVSAVVLAESRGDEAGEHYQGVHCNITTTCAIRNTFTTWGVAAYILQKLRPFPISPLRFLEYNSLSPNPTSVGGADILKRIGRS